jgi:hypothetical protein
LEKQRGNMGMTWRIKVARVAFAMVIVAALAVASGADYILWSLLSWLF